MKGNSGRTADIEKAASSATEPTKNRSATVPEADYTLMRWSLWLLFLVACRRLLTQLEVAKGGRGGAPGDGKPAPAKGPDGVVLYELHSRPEQEKFTESAKVCRMNVPAPHACNVWITNEGKGCFLCCVSVDRRAGEASRRAGDCSWLWIRQTGAHRENTQHL